jgi:hypothetical protein
VAEGILVHLQHALGRKPSRTSEEEEFIVSMQSTWAKDRAKAKEEGARQREARALLTVLRGRGMAVPDAIRDRILAEKDPARLERWLERAGTSATVAEVLGDPS